VLAQPKTPARRILALPDAHFPFQDQAAMACVLHVCRTWRPDEIVVLGDWLDGAAFSAHARRSFAEVAPAFVADEVGPCNAYLDALQGRRHRPLVYLEGNHEARVERYATGLGAAGADLYALASPQRLITHRVDAAGIPHRPRENFKWVPYLGAGVHSHYQISKRLRHSSALVAVHGWSFAKNAAQVHLDGARDVSVIHGHTHRAQSVISRNRLTGELLQAWSPGCLASLVPPYMANSPSDWTHGFSMIYVGARSWTSYTVSIHSDGSCILPDGRRVTG
jgi:predicted phosphodiesterase